MKRGLSVLIAALCAAQGEGIAQSPQPALQSHWRDVDMAIDGSHAEWSELSSFGKDVPFSVGLKNDGASLYLVLSSSDQSIPFLLMRRGLIVWFDAEGGTKKRFGIRYPVIEGGGGLPTRRPGGFGQPGGGSGRDPGREPGRPPGAEGPPEQSGQMFDPAKDGRWARLELLGPGKDDRRSLVIDKAPGIEVRIGRVEGSVVYELKVPLQIDDGHPYAIGARPGATIGVGLETPDVEKAEGGVGFGIPGRGGRPPGGGMGGGGMGGGPPGGPEGFKPPKPIKAWATVRLALVVVQP
jgi:hypothetical protein